jgi:hypothetical protein
VLRQLGRNVVSGEVFWNTFGGFMMLESKMKSMPPWLAHALLPVLFVALGLTSALAAAQVLQVPLDKKAAAKGAAAGSPAKRLPTFEVRFTDNSTMKLVVREETLEVSTRYGRLGVPLTDIQQIDFATRIPDDLAKRVDTAIANLGSPQFRERESASADLLGLQEKSYPALLEAVKHADPEVVRRAEELLARIREAVPEDLLDVRKQDVLYIEDMKIVGTISLTSLRVTTFQFGEQQVKLSDLRSLRSLASAASEVSRGAVLPDPGTLNNFSNQVGKTFSFRVVGAVNGSVWGTQVYTTDSTLATAAVHAGLLRPGQAGVVRVTIVPPPPAFAGSNQHGVASAAYGPYNGAFKVSR